MKIKQFYKKASAEGKENTERLETLQKQHFETNETKQLAIVQQNHKLMFVKRRHIMILMAEDKLIQVHKKLGQKFSETGYCLRYIF